MAPQIHEATGILRQVTYSEDGLMLVVKLDRGEIDLQFSSRRQNSLGTKLRRHVGSKVGVLWFDSAKGDQVVKIRRLGTEKTKGAERSL